MFYVGLVRRKPKQASDPEFFIRVRSEPFSFHCVAFNEKRARVAVRRYIKGNLSTALVRLDNIKANEPVRVNKKQYTRDLRHMYMIPGSGPSGFEVDYDDRRSA